MAKPEKDYKGLKPFTPKVLLFITLVIAVAVLVQSGYDSGTQSISLDKLGKVLSFHRITYSLQELDLAAFLSGLSLISYAFVLGPLARMFPYKFDDALYLRRPFGVVGFWLLLLHSLYYSLFMYNVSGSVLFSDPSMLGTLLGLIALVILYLSGITSSERAMTKVGFYGWKKLHRTGYLGLAFLVLNILLINKYNITGPIVSPFSAIFLSLGTFAIFMRIIVWLVKKPPLLEDY